MTPFVFDTLSASRQLRDAGMAEGVAEAVVSVFQHAATMPDITHLATRADLEALGSSLRGDMEALRLGTKAEMDAHRLATRADFDAFRQSIKADMETLRLTTTSNQEALRLIVDVDLEAVRRDMATKDDIAQVRLEIVNTRAALNETIRQQGWLLMGGIGALVTILNGLMKVFG